MADIPQSLYEAMRNCEPACDVASHLQRNFSVELETWLPILQGIADEGFSGHPPFLYLQGSCNLQVKTARNIHVFCHFRCPLDSHNLALRDNLSEFQISDIYG
jgi:hypothetical protein